jgi:uncharacterized repeat protein (TIGR01451 family)
MNTQITEPTCAAAPPAIPGAGQPLRRPIISVTKIPEPLALPGPGSVTYTYEVSNPGLYTMNTISLVDDKCSPVYYVSGDDNNDSALQTNEVWTYRCTTMLSQDTFNAATARGSANGLAAADIAYATVRVGTLLPPPLIHVVKRPNLFVLPFGGGRVTYTYTVTNPGVVALYSVLLTDDKCSGVRYVSGDTNGDGKLDTDETWTYTCQANIGLTTTNTVTATGKANNQLATDVAFATVAVAPPPAPVPPVILRPVAPIPPPPVVPPPEQVPLLPNTGVGPDAVSVPWGMIASGFLAALSFSFAFLQARRLASRD